MLLPHESTVATGPVSSLTQTEISRGIGNGDFSADTVENTVAISPDEAPASAISLESAKNERKVDDQLKMGKEESKKKRVIYFFI